MQARSLQANAENVTLEDKYHVAFLTSKIFHSICGKPDENPRADR